MRTVEALQPHIEEVTLPKKEEKTLSFNLSAERQRALKAKEKGEQARQLAREGFLNNVKYWGKEYIADIHTTHYYWEIVEEEGEARLFHPEFGFSDEIHKNALEEEGVPEYERQRRRVEYEMSKLLPQLTSTMEENEAIVWSSPPPENVQDDVYGGYTMTHLFEVKNVEDKKVLVGRDIKNYLSTDHQRELLEELVGQSLFQTTPSALEILSTPIIPEKKVSALRIEEKIKDLQQKKGVSREEGEEILFEMASSQHQYLLDEIFTQLESDYIYEDKVNILFKKYAKAVDKTYQTEKWKAQQQIYDEEQMQMYAVFIEDTFEERVLSGGSCGDEVGFASRAESAFGYTPSNIAPFFGRTSENFKEDPNLCRCRGQQPHFHCPGKKEGKACKHTIVVGKGISKCPKCGERKKC